MKGIPTGGPGLLRAHDPGLVELASGAGAVLLAPGVQGRIFCRIGDRLLHQLDAAALTQPAPGEFNNIGGNSLWPAPEGGDFAFNYPPGGGEWLVQEAIGAQNCTVVEGDAHSAVMEKEIQLTNRMGAMVKLRFVRRVKACTPPPEARGLQAVAYETEDVFVPLQEYGADSVLLAPWSLEQFPGSDGVTAYVGVERPQEALNLDFYADPTSRIQFGDGFLAFRLGGEERHQIGVSAEFAPQCVAALDAVRGMLAVRKAERAQGLRFDIADNDQPGGPFSAQDMYSVFNGGPLGFYELETIGAMAQRGGVMQESVLRTRTCIALGAPERLRAALAEMEGIAAGETGP